MSRNGEKRKEPKNIRSETDNTLSRGSLLSVCVVTNGHQVSIRRIIAVLLARDGV